MKKIIYLDNAATTPLDEAVLNEMVKTSLSFGNPSAYYDYGYEVADILKHCRENIASSIHCISTEIYFTSGGTESDNWALRFVAPGSHIITTAIEHHAILNTCKYLEKCGVDVTYIQPDKYGLVHVEDIESAIRPNTKLISVMAANNEIGTIQPIHDIGVLAAAKNMVFHVDAVQAYGHIPVDVNFDNIDMLSVSAHKFNGPKGVGFLYISNRIPLQPMIYGGGQQRGMRPGTENVMGIVGMSKAQEIAIDKMNERNENISWLRDYLEDGILSEIPDVYINGSKLKRLPNNTNICFTGIRSEQLLSLLNMNGICASAGSACNSSSVEPSHVLTAIGLSEDDANASLRFTLSHSNTKEEIDFVIDTLKRSVVQLRR